MLSAVLLLICKMPLFAERMLPLQISATHLSQFSSLCFSDLPHHLLAGTRPHPEDTLLQYSEDTPLLHLPKEGRPLLLPSGGRLLLHNRSSESLARLPQSREAPRWQRGARHPSLPGTGKGLLPAGPTVKPAPHCRINGIHRPLGRGLPVPPQVPHLCAEDLPLHLSKDSPHLRAPGLSGESQGPRSPKNQRSK